MPIIELNVQITKCTTKAIFNLGSLLTLSSFILPGETQVFILIKTIITFEFYMVATLKKNQKAITKLGIWRQNK